jgi:hypothetical protein
VKIEYKKPYWAKYKWELDELDKSQLVFITPFNKVNSNELCNFIYEEDFLIMCKFKIEDGFKKDTKAGIYGKSGQNFGLNFDYSIDSLVFEFRTANSKNDIEFHCIIIDKVNSKLINDGVNILVVKNKGKITIYCNSDIVSKYEYSGDLFIKEYTNSPIYLGCLNPGAKDKKDRCYSEINIEHFSITIKNNSIENILKLVNNEFYDLPMKSYYDDILCLYDFKMTNNDGIIFDNSKYSHFLELVPKEFIL